MIIIGKFLIKNILDRKLRAILIMFSILLSSALFFAANGASTTTEKISLQTKQKFCGTADIMIESNEKSPSNFMSDTNAKKLSSYFEYIIGTIEASGYYNPSKDETVQINIRGIAFDDFVKMNPVSFQEESNLLPFEGNKIIIGKFTADKYELKLGKTIDVEINGYKRRFIISAIAQPIGSFMDDGQTAYMIVSKEYLEKLFGARGKSTTLYMKMINATYESAAISDLQNEYKHYTVRETITDAEVKRDAKERTDPYKLIVVIVLFLSIFVIFSSFKVITTERMPVIGTLRSIGATKRITNALLLAESLIYGIIGGILGCISGIGILKLILIVSLPENLKNIGAEIYYTPTQLIQTFFLAIFLSVFSSIIPILSLSRIPIKDIIFNVMQNYKKEGWKKFYVSLVLIAVTFLLPRFVPKSIALYVDLICIVLPILSIVLIVPQFTNILVRILEKFFIRIFGNIGILAVKNLRDNKIVLNNISLLGICISCFLVINTLSFSVSSEMADLFRNNATFDVLMIINSKDKNLERIVYSISGVKEVYNTLAVGGTEVADTDVTIQTIQGVDANKFLDYWDIHMQEDRKTVFSKLVEGRNIILSNILKDRLKVEVGDYIKLKTSKGTIPYKVVGFFHSYNSAGSYALIPDIYLKADMGAKIYSNICLKTFEDPKQVAKEVEKRFFDQKPYVLSIPEFEKINYETYKSLFTMLKLFSVLTLVISVFGIVNNFIISFIQRRRSLAVLRSIGTSKVQIINMIIIESLSGGFVGGVIGVLCGVLMISVIPYFLLAIEQVSPIHYSPELLIGSLFVGIMLTLIASISSVTKSSKLNIIECIKFE